MAWHATSCFYIFFIIVFIIINRWFPALWLFTANILLLQLKKFFTAVKIDGNKKHHNSLIL